MRISPWKHKSPDGYSIEASQERYYCYKAWLPEVDLYRTFLAGAALSLHVARFGKRVSRIIMKKWLASTVFLGDHSRSLRKTQKREVKPSMLYIGLDVHCKWVTIAGYNPATGEIVECDRVANNIEALSMTLQGLESPLCGIMESGINSWAIYREIRPLFETLTIAEPAKLWDRRQDRRAKTDRNDAMRMAQMLYRGDVEGLYIPDERTQDLRTLIRGKVRSSRWVTRLTNEIGSLLKSWGYVGHRSLLTKGGKLDIDQAQLPAHSAKVMQLWHEMLEKAQQIEDELQALVEEESARDSDCALLQTIPGVGAFTALLVKAEIGDIRRFKHSSQLISYAGLAPRVFQSGESRYYGRLGHWGNRWLRYAIGLLAQRSAQGAQSNALRTTYWRVQFKNHRNAAKMAVARKALRVIHQMLTHQSVWDDSKAGSQKTAA